MRPEFLTRLAEADKLATPPAAVEARLRAAVRARKTRPHRLAYALLAAAAAVLVIAWAIRKPATIQAPASPVAASVEQRPVEAAPVQVAKVEPAPLPRPVQRAQRRSAPPRPVQPQAPIEQVTEFFPLTADAREIRPGSQLMRVRMPRAAMATFGFPLSAEMSRGQINADVLVGDDGIARAIRFVHGN